jgi:hypothetical protein
VARPAHAGYFVDREYVFLGRALRCFRPNWNLRLFKHALGRYEHLTDDHLMETGDNEVHEHVVVAGSVGYLRTPLVHHDERPLSAWFANHNRYSSWEAEVYARLLAEPLELSPRRWLTADAARRKRMLKRLWVRLPVRPLLRFLWFYTVKRGALDGYAGLMYALLMGTYELGISAKLMETRLRSRAAFERGARGVGPQKRETGWAS